MSEPIANLHTDDELLAEVRSLNRATKALHTEVQAKNAETRRRTNVLAGFLALVALVFGVLGVFTAQATSENRAAAAKSAAAAANVAEAIAASNRRWCPVVEPIAPRPGDPRPAGTPEQVERAQRIRAAFAQLVVDFGCR